MGSLKNTNLDVANYALECVKQVVDEKESVQKEYKTLVKKMSILIQKNGLIGTLVFNFSKKDKPHHRQVLEQMREWHLKNIKTKEIGNISKSYSESKDYDVVKDYILKITELNNIEYRWITKEMIILFNWIKRFADGMIVEGEE